MILFFFPELILIFPPERRYQPALRPAGTLLGSSAWVPAPHAHPAPASALFQLGSHMPCSVSAPTRMLLYTGEAVRSRSLLLCLLTRVSVCVYQQLTLVFKLSLPQLPATNLPPCFPSHPKRCWSKMYSEKQVVNGKSPPTADSDQPQTRPEHVPHWAEALLVLCMGKPHLSLLSRSRTEAERISKTCSAPYAAGSWSSRGQHTSDAQGWLCLPHGEHPDTYSRCLFLSSDPLAAASPVLGGCKSTMRSAVNLPGP